MVSAIGVSKRLSRESKALDITERYQMSEKLINEEFKIWKKTSPMLYDIIYTYSCKWPSLTVQWLSDVTTEAVTTTKDAVEEVLKAKFLLGTSTTGGAQNYLKLFSVDLPPTLSKTTNESLAVSKLTPLKDSSNRLNLLRQWRHPGEINKARIDENAGLIATQTNCGDILVYDYKSLDSSEAPIHTLKYHTKEGFGLEWNPIIAGRLISGNEDGKIALWDLSSRPADKVLKPARTFSTHTGIVNDLSWNGVCSELFASVSDDGSLQIHDLRAKEGELAIKVEKAHGGAAINAVEFHPTISSLVATGSTDNFVQCWDLRDYSKPIRRLYGHAGPILNMKFNNNLLLSTSVDRRVLVWDLNRIQEGEFDLKEYEKKNTEYTDPCLVFMHGGHTGRLCEADWHPALNNVVISCAEDSLVEIWRPLHLEDSFDNEETDVEKVKKQDGDKEKTQDGDKEKTQDGEKDKGQDGEKGEDKGVSNGSRGIKDEFKESTDAPKEQNGTSGTHTTDDDDINMN
ncbi:hypothetical protein FOA43_001067 [Brettanomyces nanus]|uniref:Histone-binding protein RBBP4-like N-terminal domain-containing protein n=1 Tax=Eeniella nana TaxID=13502 RepID=A0A875RYN9_EENNA|nr:uncharacterized protein FOA43_001067 [Brettanomyces nanus]QPG73753.1 hypothetical protein FOA43_001067 [Brettanomyces nanus]